VRAPNQLQNVRSTASSPSFRVYQSISHICSHLLKKHIVIAIQT
jgi:hypothetical protein